MDTVMFVVLFLTISLTWGHKDGRIKTMDKKFSEKIDSLREEFQREIGYAKEEILAEVNNYVIPDIVRNGPQLMKQTETREAEETRRTIQQLKGWVDYLTTELAHAELERQADRRSFEKYKQELREAVTNISSNLNRLPEGSGKTNPLMTTRSPSQDENTRMEQRLAGICPNKFDSYQGSCFLLVLMQVTWPDAVLLCQTAGGKLASIENEGQQNLIEDYIAGIDGVSSDIWLAGYDALAEGEWLVATNNEPLVYKNWAPGEPNNEYGENCLLLQRVGYKWNDGHCRTRLMFLCEAQPIPSVPRQGQ